MVELVDVVTVELVGGDAVELVGGWLVLVPLVIVGGSAVELVPDDCAYAAPTELTERMRIRLNTKLSFFFASMPNSIPVVLPRS